MFRNGQNILQGNLAKNTKKILEFQFFVFYPLFCSKIKVLTHLDKFVWSRRFFWYPYGIFFVFLAKFPCKYFAHSETLKHPDQISFGFILLQLANVKIPGAVRYDSQKSMIFTAP